MALLSRLIAASFCLVVGLAHAAPPPVKLGETFTMTQSANGVYQVDSVAAGGFPVSRAVTAGSVMMGSGGVNVLDTFTGTGPAGSLPLSIARNVDWDEVLSKSVQGAMAGRAVGQALGIPGAAGGAAVGAAVAAAADVYRQTRTHPTSGSGFERDLGSPPGTANVPMWIAGGQQFGDAVAACKSVLPQHVGVKVLYYYNNDTTAACGSNSGGPFEFASLQTVEAPKPCQAGHDYWTGQDYPAGQPTGSDGKCRTGQYTAQSQDQIKAMMNELAGVARPQAQVLAEGALASGQTLVPSSSTLTGPASQIGQSVTTATSTQVSTPSGTQTENTTTTKTPTHNYTYNSTENKINVSTTYQTTNVTNNPTTNVTTTTTNTTTTSGTSTAAADGSDPCIGNEDRAGCTKLGEPPSESDVPTRDVHVDITPDTSFGGGGTCPPDLSFAAFGHTYFVSWVPMCDVATTWVRPVVLVVATAIAAFVFVEGLKS